MFSSLVERFFSLAQNEVIKLFLSWLRAWIYVAGEIFKAVKIVFGERENERKYMKTYIQVSLHKFLSIFDTTQQQQQLNEKKTTRRKRYTEFHLFSFIRGRKQT